MSVSSSNKRGFTIDEIIRWQDEPKLQRSTGLNLGQGQQLATASLLHPRPQLLWKPGDLQQPLPYYSVVGLGHYKKQCWQPAASPGANIQPTDDQVSQIRSPASSVHQHSTGEVTTKRRRALGRSPRVPFSPHQVHALECKFLHSRYLSSADVCQLSANLNLSEARVKIWFQNRRARAKREDTPSLLHTPLSTDQNHQTN